MRDGLKKETDIELPEAARGEASGDSGKEEKLLQCIAAVL